NQASTSKTENRAITIEQALPSETGVHPSPILLKLNCIVEEESTSFPVEILSSKSVGALKNLILPGKPLEAKNIILKLTPDGGVTKKGLEKLTENSLEVLDDELHELSTYFPEKPANDLIHIVAKLPEQAQKRDREEDDNIESELVSKKYRPSISSSSSEALIDAIRKAGFTTMAITDDGPDLSLLNLAERAKVLSFIGRASRNSSYHNITRTARELLSSNTNMKEISVLTSPGDRGFPVVETADLFIRDEYKRFYDHIISDFRTPTTVNRLNRFFIIGTPGIGKSAFLVYFAIRQLVDHDLEDPPIIISHEKKSETCYAYGGTTCQRKGNREEFADFLELPKTWYLVDSGNNPQPDNARTIFTASPRILHDEYDEFAKGATCYSYYHMSPWNLEQLRECKESVRYFQSIGDEFLEELYSNLGGIPRQILQSPADALFKKPGDIQGARKAAFYQVDEAIKRVEKPDDIINLFAQGSDRIF
ncbi:hypothetical protein BGZ46_007243, partial [Entomortierella lignicola]